MTKKKLVKAVVKKFGTELSLKETPFILFEIMHMFKKDFYEVVYKKPYSPVADEPGVPNPPPPPPPPDHPPGEPGSPDGGSKLIFTMTQLNKSIRELTTELKKSTKPRSAKKS